MKIIKEGDLSGYLLRGTCRKCNCEVEFYHNEEGVWWNSDQERYEVDCPTPHCEEDILVYHKYIS